MESLLSYILIALSIIIIIMLFFQRSQLKSIIRYLDKGTKVEQIPPAKSKIQEVKKSEQIIQKPAPRPTGQSFSDKRKELNSTADEIVQRISSLGVERGEVSYKGDLVWVRFFKKEWPHTLRNAYLMSYELRMKGQKEIEVFVLAMPNMQGLRRGESRLTGAEARRMVNNLRERSKSAPGVWGENLRERKALHGAIQIDARQVPAERINDFCSEYIKKRLDFIGNAMAIG